MCVDDDGSASFEPSAVVDDLDHHAPDTAIMRAMHKSSAIATAGAGRRHIDLRYLMVACVCEPLLDCAIMMFLARFINGGWFCPCACRPVSPEQAGHKCFVSGHQVTSIYFNK